MARKQSMETIVFTPFTPESLNEVRIWIAKDSKEDLTYSFGETLFRSDSTIDYGFLARLQNSEITKQTHSMSVTIRTSYRTLINIGFVQLKTLNHSPTDCSITYFYIFKPFRRKDYEYMSLRKTVEFALKELKCDRCFIWIHEGNYLFLSLAKTANFQLVKIAKDPGKCSKYCFMISKSTKRPLVSCGECVTGKHEKWQQTAQFDVFIPDYQNFKNKLLTINRVHALTASKTQRKSTLWYSPIIKPNTGERKHNRGSMSVDISTHKKLEESGNKSYLENHKFRTERVTINKPLGSKLSMTKPISDLAKVLADQPIGVTKQKHVFDNTQPLVPTKPVPTHRRYLSSVVVKPPKAY